jgi:predicted ribosomally synthesized peptide with nif11-like leader
MSLEQLDAFLAHAKSQPALDQRLHDPEHPLELEEFLRLAQEAGFALSEADVIAAQQREEGRWSDAELQHRAGAEACRLRHFIPG